MLTTRAIITCNHGGTVALTPHQEQVMIEGGFVICEPDLIGAPISGCRVPVTAATSPCKNVISTLEGSTAPTVLVVGRAVYVQTLTGETNGRPTGTITTDYPGQTTVQAP